MDPTVDPQPYIDIVTNENADESDRIDACHVLGHILGKEVVDALVSVLADKDSGVRWAACEALIQHRTAAVEPILSELATKPEDSRFYSSAHHVLTSIVDPTVRKIIEPVVKALEEPAGSEVTVPVAAYKALGELRS